MLALRLARGARPAVQLRRLLVAVAAAGTALLLLATLGHAVDTPRDAAGSALRLAWCLVPLAATAQLAVAVARTDPAARLREGMAAAGLGPVRLTLVAAASTLLACALGSVLALLVFLRLRGDLGGTPVGPAALLGRGPLPYAAVGVLLAAVPLVAAAATAVALRPGRNTPSAPCADDPPRTDTATPAGLPWGIALTAAGLALEVYAAGHTGPGARLLPLPGGAVTGEVGVLTGWLLSAAGLVLAAPGLVHLIGRVLSMGRSGAVRLLAGRVLQEESRRLGRPLGVLMAAASGAYAGYVLYGPGTLPLHGHGAHGSLGPLTALGAGLVLACTVFSVLATVAESRTARTATTEALRRLGTPAGLLRRAAALRASVLVVILAAVTGGVAHLAAGPLGG
ncbi:hypothetical protein C3486_35790 [Streptomyces sp. Ru73]|uniref:hypothetical protein n=1 Tax=Streptomyces sp. Ru73 TaxID=2080748 RepID=UPI000CDE3758|nr:hypothetical protein [Streptomyces sp. Ru73]POX36013.1 hypothetical protein C3486_35790 [Streptomyces sp. Ru73]